MEIERKFLIPSIPFSLDEYTCRPIQQGYLCTDPVIRIRRDADSYELTYKSKGFLSRREETLPLTKDSFLHLLSKIDGRLIQKKRYLIPLDPFVIELDLFQGDLAPLMLAEVEFPDEATARAFLPPDWFGQEVTYSSAYQNSTLSRLPAAGSGSTLP